MIRLTVNGKPHRLDIDAEMPLLWALRDHLRLTGTKFGCGRAQCGACTVHLDGQAVRSCAIRLADAAGGRVTTIEGIGGAVATAVRKAWRELDVVQCGYCQSGQIMSAVRLLSEIRKPTDADIDAAMDGNICRCGAYLRIRQAIHRAAAMLA